MTTRPELIEQDNVRYLTERLRTDIVSYPPRWVTIAIISRCTNRCVFCSYHSPDGRGGKSKVYRLDYKMSVERFRNQVDFFYAGRVPHVHICATGDPFLHDGIVTMIDHVIYRYGKASFQSNFNRAIMARGDYLEKIIERKHNLSYIVTDIHAGDEPSFNRIKKGSSFSDLVATLRLLSRHGIRIIGSCIVTRSNYRSLDGIVEMLAAHDIDLQLNIVGLFPHMFNEFTSIENAYHASDSEITACLQALKNKGERLGVVINTPKPFDDPGGTCNVFWEKIQVWPVAGIERDRYDENLVPHACNAVVLGEMNSLGYVSDYSSVMDLWNNEHIVKIRRKILAGRYPDRYCWSCASGKNLTPEAGANPLTVFDENVPIR